jgi:hypothetical protein
MDQTIGATTVILWTLILVFIGTRKAAGHRYRRAFSLLLVAAAARIAASLIVTNSGLLPLLASDSQFYDQVGWSVADGWQQTGVDCSWLWRTPHYARFTYVVATLYYFSGWQPWLAGLIMALLGGLAAVGVYLIGARHFDEQIGWRAGWFTALLPTLILWTSLILKEAPSIFALVVVLGSVLSLRERISMGPVISLLAALFVLDIMRSYIAVIVAMTAVTALLLTPARRSPLSPLTRIVLCALLGLVLSVRGYGFMGLDFQGFKGGVQSLNQQRIAYTGSGSRTAYLKGVTYSNGTEAATFLPLGIAYFLLSPFPWQIGSKVSVLALLEMPVWYLLFTYSLIGIVGLVRDRERREIGLTLGLFLGALICLYGLVSGNVGTAMRHRAQVMPIFMLAAALGYTEHERQRAQLRDARLRRLAAVSRGLVAEPRVP